MTRATLALSLAIALGALGCAAPTLPLPPPTALASVPDADGLVTITGMVRPAALVVVINEMARDPMERGVVVDADDRGFYTARIRAMPGDAITVFAREGTSDSQIREVIVPAVF